MKTFLCCSLALLLAGCSASPPPPVSWPALLGPWAPPRQQGTWTEVIFEADQPPCDGWVCAYYPEGLAYQAAVRWSVRGQSLHAEAKDQAAPPLAQLQLAAGQLRGTLSIFKPVIEPSGSSARLEPLQLEFAGSPRRARIPLYPGARLQAYERDRVTSAGGRIFHCELFHYSVEASAEQLQAFYSRQFGSQSGPLASSSDGLQVLVVPASQRLEVWLERPSR